MAQNLVSEEQVKEALQINKFSEISKESIKCLFNFVKYNNEKLGAVLYA